MVVLVFSRVAGEQGFDDSSPFPAIYRKSERDFFIPEMHGCCGKCSKQRLANLFAKLRRRSSLSPCFELASIRYVWLFVGLFSFKKNIFLNGVLFHLSFFKYFWVSLFCCIETRNLILKYLCWFHFSEACEGDMFFLR